MGGLASHPKKPPVAPTVAYVPAPATPSTPAPSSNAGGDSNSATGSPEPTSGEDNLLLRDRGLFGTALTGFRGLLALADNAGKRKTLLGE